MDGGAKKVFIWIFILFLAILGAYIFYGRYWGAEKTFSALGDFPSIALAKISDFGNFVKERTSRTFEKGIESSYSYAKKGVGNGLASLAGGIEGISDRLSDDSSSGTSSTSSSTSSSSIPVVLNNESGFLNPSPFYSLVARINEEITFSVNRESTFSVDWGDGSVSSGESGKESFSTLRHSWKRKGDYTVSFEIRERGIAEPRKFSFPVRIYE